MKRLIVILLLLATAAHARPRQFAVSQTEQVTKGLVAYWSMRNSGTTVYDETGANNGTAAGGVAFGYANGLVGDGGNFDGADDYVVNAAANFGLNGATKASFGAWVYCAGTTGSILWKHINLPADQSYASFGIAVLTGGVVRAVVQNAGGLDYPAWSTGAATMPTNQWTFIMCVWDRVSGNSTDMKIYIDGVSTALSFATNGYTSSFTMQETTHHIVIGAAYATSYSTLFTGKIDEVRIYNRAITADEVTQLYRMGKTIYNNR
jgi:hypothetical protein